MTKEKRKFHLVAPSTRRFFRTASQIEGYSFFEAVHGYIYGRWPYLYIGFGKGDHPLAKNLSPLFSLKNQFFPNKNRTSKHSLTQASHTHADGYHGKALPLETAKELVMVKEAIRVEDLEQVVPYVTARAILQEAPDHIVVLDCPCRVSKEHYCEPADVCLIIGEPFASFIVEHHPKKSRWISREEAVDILEAEDRRGHVHHAFFKEAMLGRFYAICNCCSCCCGAMMFHRQGVPMLASSGYVAYINEELCINCGQCQETCQFSALSFDETGQNIINWENCMGCGVCIGQCQQDAIALKLEPAKGVPLEISALV